MDKIFLNGMRFYAYHGVLPEERRLGQHFEVDVVLELVLRHAGLRDELALTVNYADVYRLVEEIMTGEPVQLVESLAERIARAVLGGFPCEAVRVRVVKPNPPIAGHYHAVGVEIERRRDDA